jgi:sugar lactone lactonase YvrE
MATKTETKTQDSPTTVTEVVNRIALGKVSPEDGARLIAQLSQNNAKARSRVIKLNSAGGLYVTDPSLRAYSEKKSKHYQAGFNLSPIDACRALFSNDELLAAIKQFLSQE